MKRVRLSEIPSSFPFAIPQMREHSDQLEKKVGELQRLNVELQTRLQLQEKRHRCVWGLSAHSLLTNATSLATFPLPPQAGDGQECGP